MENTKLNLKFSTGDKVMIDNSSRYYSPSGQDFSNPRDTVGVITTIHSPIGTYNPDRDHVYRVNWINGYTNSYREQDLKLSISIESNNSLSLFSTRIYSL